MQSQNTDRIGVFKKRKSENKSQNKITFPLPDLLLSSSHAKSALTNQIYCNLWPSNSQNVFYSYNAYYQNLC